MKKVIIFGLLLFVVSGVFAQQAVIKELSGTVEIKRPGSTIWEPAAIGNIIMGNTVISTGFKSQALLSIGNSVLAVRPLTRLTLTELSAQAGTETINVNLQAGRVRAEINPPAGARANVTTQTPVATASVRGTVYEIDVFSIWVSEGSVEYSGSSGNPVIISAGGTSSVDEKTGRAAPPIETMASLFAPDLPIGFEYLNTFDCAVKQNDLDAIGIIDFP